MVSEVIDADMRRRMLQLSGEKSIKRGKQWK
jgi:hypothetical protein